VEKLTDAAAPALLKTLEDGVPKTVFILVTSVPSQVLPTISSRCTHVEFKPLTSDQVREIIEPKIGNADLLDVCVSYSNGSPGRALEFYRTGVPLRKGLVKILRKLRKADYETISEVVGESDPEMFFEVLLSLLLDSRAVKVGGKIKNLDLTKELDVISEVVAPRFAEIYEPVNESLHRLDTVPPKSWPFHLKTVLVQMREVARG
jgi:hypothetical protein